MLCHGQIAAIDSTFETRGHDLPVIPFTLTHTGVQRYAIAGKVVNVLKHPEHFITDRLLQSARHIPLTLGHPNGKVVSLDTIDEAIIVGMTSDTPAQRSKNGHEVRHQGTIHSKELLQAIQNQKITDVSAGYLAEFKANSGVWTDEQGQKHKYDMVQHDPSLNHVAFVHRGRMPRSKIITDSQDDHAIWLPPEENMDEIKELLIKLTADSENKSEAEIARLVAAIDAKNEELESLKSDLQGLQAINDGEEERKNDALKALQEKVEVASKVFAKASLPMQELLAMDSQEAILSAGLKALSIQHDPKAPAAYLQGVFDQANHPESAAQAIADAKPNTGKSAQERIQEIYKRDLERNRKAL